MAFYDGLIGSNGNFNGIWLVVSTNPSEKWWSSSVGMMILPNGKIKHVPVTTNQRIIPALIQHLHWYQCQVRDFLPIQANTFATKFRCQRGIVLQYFILQGKNAKMMSSWWYLKSKKVTYTIWHLEVLVNAPDLKFIAGLTTEPSWHFTWQWNTKSMPCFKHLDFQFSASIPFFDTIFFTGHYYAK